MNPNKEAVIKGLKCCIQSTSDCDNCPYYKGNVNVNCFDIIKEDAIELIEELFAEKESYRYILMGAMRNVDRFLEGDELKLDEMNRAATMREKILQASMNNYSEIRMLKTENKMLKKENETVMSLLLRLTHRKGKY